MNYAKDSRPKMTTTSNMPAKNQLPKSSMAKPSGSNYAIPSSTRMRDMDMRMQARDNKPSEQRFLEDIKD